MLWNSLRIPLRIRYVDIIKRRSPSCTEPLAIALQPTPVPLSPHARLSRQSAVEVATRSRQKEEVA